MHLLIIIGRSVGITKESISNFIWDAKSILDKKNFILYKWLISDIYNIKIKWTQANKIVEIRITKKSLDKSDHLMIISLRGIIRVQLISIS